MNVQHRHYPQSKRLSSSPFSNYKFYNHLEESNLLTEDTGWEPLYFEIDSHILPSFIKTHSYGEYIFDWDWANFYQRIGMNYYPKLLHSTPFTPVNAPKFHHQNQKELAQMSFDFYQENNLSGEHYLFISIDEAKILKDLGFSVMKTIQYHFYNQWRSFDHFLDSLKTSRKKMIKKERKKCLNFDVTINWLLKEDCSDNVLNRLYQLYLSTIKKKNSYAYLNDQFFKGLKKFLNEEAEILIAKVDNSIIAMSIFFKSNTTLYGRYWGIDSDYAEEFKLLHFEMCYYKGIDYIIDNQMSLFEAGAQGEQKLWRGFSPVEILSAHHIKDAQAFNLIKDYIKKQSLKTEEEIKKLKQFLPYKEVYEKN